MQVRRVIRALLADLYFFAFLHGVLSLAAYLLLGDARPFLTALALLAPFFAMSAVRLRVDNSGLFLLFHVLLCFAPVFFGVGRALQGFLFLFLLISMLYSFIVRVKGDWYPSVGATAFLVSLSAVTALVAEYFAFRQPAQALFFWVFVMIAAAMICRQTAAVDASLAILADSARQPVGTTMRYSNFILAAFMLPVGAVGLLSAFLPLDRLGRLLVDGLLALYGLITGLLMRLLSLFGGGESAPLPTEEAAPPPDMAAMLPPPGEAPVWMRILEEALVAVVMAAVAALLLFGAVRGLKSLYKQLYQKKQWDGEQREYIGPELRFENLRGTINRARRRLPAFGESEEERVRRRYYKKIRRHIRRGVAVRPADTAGDIERRLREKEDVANLTADYNRARYRIKK